MTALGLAALTLLAFLVRWPTFKVPLENNGAAYLYNLRFRTRDYDCTGLMGLVYVLAGFYRLFGERWGYRWVRGVMAGANALVIPSAYVLGATLEGPGAGWAAAGFYAVFSSVPHLIPWFTAAERIYVPLSTGAYAAFAASIGHSPVWAAASGLLAGACVLCKVTSAIEFLPLLALPWFTSSGAGDAALREALLVAGLCVAPGLELARLWRVGAIAGTRASVRGLRERYRAADLLLVDLRAGSAEGGAAAKWSLDLLSGTSPVWAFAIPWLAHTVGIARTPLALAVVGWYAATLATTAWRANWVPGHWVPQVPPLCVMAGLGLAAVVVAAGPTGVPTFLAALLVVAGCVWAWASGRVHPWHAWRYVAFQGAFQALGERVRELTQEGDRVFCWGWQPQIYLFAGRPSASPRHLFSGPRFLDTADPEWRKGLTDAFAQHRPACVTVLGEGLPLAGIAAIAGLRYRPVPPTPQIAGGIFVRTEAPAEATPPGSTCEAALERLRLAIEGGDTATAASLLHAFFLLKMAPPDAEARLDDLQPGWRWVHPGALPEPPGEVVIEEAKNGGRTAGVRIGEEVRWLHSRYAPQTEAERLASDIHLAADGACLFLGLGLGHVAAEVARTAPPGAVLVALERRRGLARAALAEHEALRGGRVRVVVAAAVEALEPLIDSLAGKQVLVYAHHPSMQLDGDYYRAVAEAVTRRSAP